MGCFSSGVRVVCVAARDGLSRRPLDTGVRLGPSRSLVTGGGALSLPPGDDHDHDGRWGNTLSPGGLGFGFASGDTKPYIFWHPLAPA